MRLTPGFCLVFISLCFPRLTSRGPQFAFSSLPLLSYIIPHTHKRKVNTQVQNKDGTWRKVGRSKQWTQKMAEKTKVLRTLGAKHVITTQIFHPLESTKEFSSKIKPCPHRRCRWNTLLPFEKQASDSRAQETKTPRATQTSRLRICSLQTIWCHSCLSWWTKPWRKPSQQQEHD